MKRERERAKYFLHLWKWKHTHTHIECGSYPCWCRTHCEFFSCAHTQHFIKAYPQIVFHCLCMCVGSVFWCLWPGEYVYDSSYVRICFCYFHASILKIHAQHFASRKLRSIQSEFQFDGGVAVVTPIHRLNRTVFVLKSVNNPNCKFNNFPTARTPCIPFMWKRKTAHHRK